MTSEAAPTAAAAAAKATRKAAAPQVGAKPQSHEQRSLDPPRGQHDEHRSEPWILEGRSGLDERTVEVEQWSHRREETQSSKTARLIVVVNGRASGIEDPLRTADELVAMLEELGAEAESAVTYSEQQLWDVLRFAETSGGGSRSSAAMEPFTRRRTRPLARLPELALVPAGRANNIARALGIPTGQNAGAGRGGGRVRQAARRAACGHARPLHLRARGGERRIPGGGSR